MHVNIVRDWSDAAAVFDAAVYPSLLVATRSNSPTRRSMSLQDEQTAGLNVLRKVAPPAAPSPACSSDELAHRIRITVTRGAHEHVFDIPRHSLSMGADSAAPWLLLPPDARTAFERVRQAGPALGDSSLGRPLLGVKCGLNAAFLVNAIEHDDDTASISCDGRDYLVERCLLRPALRRRSNPAT